MDLSWDQDTLYPCTSSHENFNFSMEHLGDRARGSGVLRRVPPPASLQQAGGL